MSIDENSTQRKSLTVHPLGIENLPTITTPKQQIRQMSEVNLLNYSELDAAKIIYPSMRDIGTLNTFRELRTKLIQKADKNNFTVMVSSLASAGGGSYVSVNLAAAFALDFEKTALLVDCNHTSSYSDKLLPTGVDFGLTDYLVDPGLAVSDIIYATGIPRLRLTPIGNQVSAESEFFTSDRMDEFMHEVKSRYAERYVIVDAPSINGSPDARVLADLCDYTVLVVPYGKVTKAQISAGINSIPSDKFAGLVFNN